MVLFQPRAVNSRPRRDHCWHYLRQYGRQSLDHRGTISLGHVDLPISAIGRRLVHKVIRVCAGYSQCFFRSWLGEKFRFQSKKARTLAGPAFCRKLRQAEKPAAITRCCLPHLCYSCAGFMKRDRQAPPQPGAHELAPYPVFVTRVVCRGRPTVASFRYVYRIVYPEFASGG